MTKRNWLAFCSGSAALLAITALACGPEFFPEDDSLFDPAAGVPERASELLYDPGSQWFGHTGDWGDAFHGQNLTEWREWLRLDSAGAAEWDSVLYTPAPSRLDSALAFAEGTGKLPKAWKDFEIFSKIPRERLKQALRYADFAARTEPWSRRGEEESWSPSRKLPRQDEPQLFDQGLSVARRIKDPFLRQRWFFQLGKFAFYTRPDSALDFLDSIAPELSKPSASLFWRSRMYRAGLSKDPAAHNLECARVAWNFPPLASMAAKDFILPQKDRDWQHALALAHSSQDRQALWFLMGLRSDALEATNRMLAEDSAAPMVEVLATRALAQAEWTHGKTDALERLSMRLAASRRVAAPAFWNLLAGHLSGLSGRPEADIFLDAALRLSKGDTAIALQARMSRVLARLHRNPSPSPDLEDFLRRELPAIDSHRTARWAAFDRVASDRMGKIWSKDAELSQCLMEKLPSTPDSLVRLLSFWERQGGTFEEFAKRRSGLTDSSIRVNLGVALLLRDRLDEAAKTLSSVPALEPLGTDPFQAEIRDNHDRDHAAFAKAPWTRASFASELARLDALARTGGPEGAKAALRLGIGLYNQTWFGNARSVYDGTVASWHNDPVRMNLAPARQRFEQAAHNLPTAEGRAWATWLAAKCERDESIFRGDSINVPTKSYENLRSRYAKTPFWRRALRECGWLSSWARR